MSMAWRGDWCSGELGDWWNGGMVGLVEWWRLALFSKMNTEL
jgi:hypothetical protein